MKKNNNFMIIGMLFMTSMLAELYFLLEFRENIALILGGGAIVLLTTYLLFAWFQEYLVEKKDVKINEGNEIGGKSIDTSLIEEILKFQKASYLTMHQMIDYDKSKDKKWEEELEIFKEEIIEAENNAAKLVAKYHREDIKYIIKNLKEASSKIAISIERIAEKSTVQEITDGVSQSLQTLEGTVKEIEILLEKGEFAAKRENQPVTETSDDLYAEERKLNSVKEEQLKESKIETGSHKVLTEEINNDEINSDKIKNNEIKTEDINNGEVKYEAINNNIILDKEIDEVIESNETEEIENNIQVNNKDIEKELEKKPIKELKEPKEADQNKPMSPEEIAAMIASMDSGNGAKEEKEAEKKEQTTQKLAEEVKQSKPETNNTANATNNESVKVPEAPKDADPNKQMSPEEIAALFASMK